MYCTHCRKTDHHDADCWSTRGANGPPSVCWRDVKTDPVLLSRLENAASRPMTPEEAFEQRVSFVFSVQDSMKKDEVRTALKRARDA